MLLSLDNNIVQALFSDLINFARVDKGFTMQSKSLIGQSFEDIKHVSKYIFQKLFCYLPGNSDTDALEYFTESLSKFTRFSGFRPLATLSYASEVHNGSSIVSR